MTQLRKKIKILQKQESKKLNNAKTEKQIFKHLGRFSAFSEVLNLIDLEIQDKKL